MSWTWEEKIPLWFPEQFVRYWLSQAARGWEYYANGLRTATVTLTQRDDGILSLLGRERGEGGSACSMFVCVPVDRASEHRRQEAQESNSSLTPHAVRAVSQSAGRDEDQWHALCLWKPGLVVQFRGWVALEENELWVGRWREAMIKRLEEEGYRFRPAHCDGVAAILDESSPA